MSQRLWIKSCLSLKRKVKYKKSYRHVRKGRESILDFINENNENYSVKTMCKVLNIPRSIYYNFVDKTPSKRAIENQKYKSKILAIYKNSSERYGSPKIHKVLTNQGFNISIKRVRGLMKKLNIAQWLLNNLDHIAARSKSLSTKIYHAEISE